MVTQASLTYQTLAQSVFLRGEGSLRVRIKHRARIAVLDIPGSSAGDITQWLGRKSKRIDAEAVLYVNGNDTARDLQLSFLKTWVANGTKLDFFSPTESAGLQVYIETLEVIERPGKGLAYVIDLVEVGAATGSPPGVPDPRGGTETPIFGTALPICLGEGPVAFAQGLDVAQTGAILLLTSGVPVFSQGQDVARADPVVLLTSTVSLHQP